MVYHVVVDELDVARCEAHPEAQLLGKCCEEVERLPSPVAYPRHLAFRPALRRFDIGARIMAGELAVADPPHGKRVGRLVGRVLLAEAAAPEVLVERGAQVGAAFEHRVVHRRRGAQLAQAALRRLADAEQRDDVAAVDVEAQ